MASEGTGTVRKAGVVGLGTMGSGIAQLCVQAGVPTVAVESTRELAERGKGLVERQLARSVEKGRLTEDDKERTLGLLEAADDVAALADCDLVIEAVFEDLAVKHDLFTRIEAVVAPATVLATNTSALSVTEIAAVLARPRARRGHALLQPRAGAAARRGDPRRAHLGRRRSRLPTRSRSRSARTRSPAATHPASSSTGS